MGFMQTGNGGCHTRQYEIDARLLLLCPYSRELVLRCTQLNIAGFTTLMTKPASTGEWEYETCTF